MCPDSRLLLDLRGGSAKAACARMVQKRPAMAPSQVPDLVRGLVLSSYKHYSPCIAVYVVCWEKTVHDVWHQSLLRRRAAEDQVIRNADQGSPAPGALRGLSPN